MRHINCINYRSFTSYYSLEDALDSIFDIWECRNVRIICIAQRERNEFILWQTFVSFSSSLRLDSFKGFRLRFSVPYRRSTEREDLLIKVVLVKQFCSLVCEYIYILFLLFKKNIFFVNIRYYFENADWYIFVLFSVCDRNIMVEILRDVKLNWILNCQCRSN